jgi:non-homologous end joining protein Ku
MPLPKEMLSLAEHIIEIKLVNFDPAYLEDRYRTVIVSTLKEKSAQLPARPKPAAIAAARDRFDRSAEERA